MQFFFRPMNVEEARVVLGWRDEGPYAVYNMQDDFDGDGKDGVAELLDRRSPH